MIGRQELPAEVCRDSGKAFMGSCLGVFEMCGSDIGLACIVRPFNLIAPYTWPSKSYCLEKRFQSVLKFGRMLIRPNTTGELATQAG